MIVLAGDDALAGDVFSAVTVIVPMRNPALWRKALTLIED
jgi:hypothetical protein